MKMTPAEFDRFADAVMQVESRGRDVVNPRSGASGPMQVMPDTLRDPGYGVSPARNNSLTERVRVGRDYLKAMVSISDTPEEAAARYNRGPGAIDRHGMETNPAETRAYVPEVLRRAGLAGSQIALAAQNAPASEIPPQTPMGSSPGSAPQGATGVSDMMALLQRDDAAEAPNIAPDEPSRLPVLLAQLQAQNAAPAEAENPMLKLQELLKRNAPQAVVEAPRQLTQFEAMQEQALAPPPDVNQLFEYLRQKHLGA